MDGMRSGAGRAHQMTPADFSSVMPYAEASLRVVFRPCQANGRVDTHVDGDG